MRRFAPLFCALILLSPTLRATPAEDFTPRGNYKNFGHLGDEMLRAVHLVVDTGLHSMDGKREEAIRALRKYAEKELGQTSELSSFHDEILKNGAWPMSVPENHMKEWIAKKKSA